MAKTDIESRTTEKKEGPAVARRVPEESSRVAGAPAVGQGRVDGAAALGLDPGRIRLIVVVSSAPDRARAEGGRFDQAQ